MRRLKKFNEVLRSDDPRRRMASQSISQVTSDDVSYVTQVFDDVIEQCEVKNLTPGSAWRGSNNEKFVALDTYEIKYHGRELILIKDSEIKNAICLYFIYDKERTRLYDMSIHHTDVGECVVEDSDFLDFIEDVGVGVKRMKQDPKWRVYYSVVDETVKVYLHKIS